MKSSVKTLIYKFLKITGLSIAGLLLLLFLAPILFPGTVAARIKQWTNESLNGELNFSKARLSFFNHFPSLTLTLYDFSLKGSAPFRQDTLVAAQEVALGIDLSTLVFNKSIHIDEIFVSGALLNIEVNPGGEANYNVYVSDKKKAASSDTAGGTALKLERIVIEKSHLVYDDASLPMQIEAHGFYYYGYGDLSKSVFDLHSHAKADSVDFSFGNESYLQRKSLDASLITKINTHSLSFLFEKNDLLINTLPVQFSGKLDFLANGYDLDFTVNSSKTDLRDFLSALPPQYNGWLQKAKVSGTTDMLFKLKGQYIASANRMPDLDYSMSIDDGYISYDNAPLPASNLYLRFNTRLPSLNPDSLQLNLDSLFFNIDKDYCSAALHVKGIARPLISARVNTVMDLEKLDRALGFSSIDIKGKYKLRLSADGVYARAPNPHSLRPDTVVVSIPSFTLQSQLEDGYFKYNTLPLPVTGIGFHLDAACAGQDYKNIVLSLTGLQAAAGSNFIRGHAAMKGWPDADVDAQLQSDINLAELKKIYPANGLDVSGLLKLVLDAKGRYAPATKSFPLVTAAVNLQNGAIRSSYYPHPISNIQVVAKASDATGTMKDLNVFIAPASFEFEGKPFTLQASFQNFDDIAYAVKANGTIDLGKIYQVFARKGIDVTGFIKADLSLQGRQSDALQKRYGRLHNQGILQVSNIATSWEAFPQPFIIRQGLFRFQQDKMWFNTFNATYGQSDLSMSGYLQNAIGYTLSRQGTLKGDFTLSSRFINADELMAFAPPANATAGAAANTPQLTASGTTTAAVQPAVSRTGETGVVIVPANLDIRLKATARRLAYNGLLLDSVAGNLSIDSGRLAVTQTGFTLIGCKVLMDAHYGSLSPTKAFFDYHLQASDFDINKAWREIKLFHDMASSAGKAYGIVSLDYNLKGKLDGSMRPVYPSLEGGGTLSLKKIKLKGFKLFSAVGRETGKEGLNDPDLSKVDIKTTVKNNIITLERVRMKIAGFRPRIEGQVSLDGQLNLKMRLGLPPFGIIGIPMHVSGTQESPHIKLGRNDKEEIPETEYKEE